MRLCLTATHSEENKWLGERSLIPCSLDASEDSHSSIVARLFTTIIIYRFIMIWSAVCHHLHRDFGVTKRSEEDEVVIHMRTDEQIVM